MCIIHDENSELSDSQIDRAALPWIPVRYKYDGPVGVAMASVFPQSRTHEKYGSAVAAPRLARAMTWHASTALLAFAGLQLWGVIALANMPGARILPFVALGLLILIAVPFARRLERHWRDLAASALPSSGLLMHFRRDRTRLWRLALIIPTLWLGLFAVVAEAAPFF